MYFSLRENMMCSVRVAFYVGHGNSNYVWAGFANGQLGQRDCIGQTD